MQDKVFEYMDWPRIESVVYAEESSPRDVMAPRITEEGILIQGFFPGAESVSVLAKDRTFAMSLQDEAGYYAVLLPFVKIPAYRFNVTRDGRTETFADPYAFPCQIDETEEKAFLAGVWYDAYTKLGSHEVTIDGVSGTLFAVWAPNALRVSIVSDVNQWDGRLLPMHRMPMTGIYELFVPGIKAGTMYKYEMLLKGGVIQLKADPYARRAEGPGGDASVVASSDEFAWTDLEWISTREGSARFDTPTSIYETTLADWENYDDLLNLLIRQGYTHVELHPVMEFLEDGSDGYPSSSLFAVSARYGQAADLKKLINDLHSNRIGVILDWNAAQFPRNEAGLALFDGTPLYEPADPAAAVHPMWNTMLFNYGSPMVTEYLLSNACFWAEEFHADGLRLDDVDAMLYLDYGKKEGEYTPNIYGSNENLQAVEFLKHFNSIMHKRYPGFLTIAQEDGLWPCLTGSVEDDFIGFDYKWSGGWTGDLLTYLKADPIMRGGLHDQLTLSMLYAYSEHYILTLGSRDAGDIKGLMDAVWGDEAQKAAQARAAYAYMYLHPGGKMAFPGKDVPEEFEQLIRDLNRIYRSCPALYSKDDVFDGFEWIQLMKQEENVLAFLRKGEKPEDTLLAVCNFSAVSYPSYQVGVPYYGRYKEIFNSDQQVYGGSGFVNPRGKASALKECDERDCSVKLKLAPLSVCVFSCMPDERPSAAWKEEKETKKAETAGAKKKSSGAEARKKGSAGKKKAVPVAKTLEEATEKARETAAKAVERVISGRKRK